MMPVYVDSYPRQRNQAPFAQCYYPSYDGFRPQVLVDQAKSPMLYGSWPPGNNYGYSIPCQACCGHGNFSGYYGFRPPVSYFPPSSPLHNCGHHPMFTEPYPVHYSLPSPHPMEQRRYEYDKDAYRDYHCCGCPNHVCNQKSDKGVKIEEHEPDLPSKRDSLVPVETKSYPYPIVWIPPQYMKRNNEYWKPLGSEVANQDKVPRDTKPSENMKTSEKEPRVLNGWFPLDINNLESLMQSEDQRSAQNQQNEDKMRRFPNPVIWMPYNDEKEQAEKDQTKAYGWFPPDMNGLKSLMQGGEGKKGLNQQNEEKTRRFRYPLIWMPCNSEQGVAEKEMNTAPTAEGPYSRLKFMSMKPPESDDSMNNSEKNEEITGGQFKNSQVGITGSQNLVPVKKVGIHTKEQKSGSEKKTRDVQSKEAEGVTADNPCGTGGNGQSSSPPKTSKLPPVCLKVEPLPKKKNGNGISRSPSPPGFKEESKRNSRISASSNFKENSLRGTQAPDDLMKKSEEMGPMEGGTKVDYVVDGKTHENRNDECSGSQMKNYVELPFDKQADIPKNSTAQATREEDERERCEKDKMAEVATEADKAIHSAQSADGECGRKIRKLSDVEAASLIQSAYRGFEVRKLEPLKKLRQMAQVREQMAEVRKRVEALESSSDLQRNNREKDIIGEMIMRLLLQLDTIQGLHPSLRDVRKAMARELVILQEKLDALMTKEVKELSEEMFTSKAADDPSINTHGGESMKEIQNKEAEIVESSSENSVHAMKMEEPDQGQLSQMVDLVCNTQCQGTLEPSLADKGMHEGCENEVRYLLLASGLESQVGESAPNIEEHKPNSVKNDVTEDVKTEIQEVSRDEQPVELPSVSEEKSTSEEITLELRQDLSYDVTGREDEASLARADDATQVDEDKVEDARVDGATQLDDNLQVKELSELPSKLIKEEKAVSELENSELVGEGTDKRLDGGMETNMLAGPNLGANVDNIVAEVEVNYKIATTKESETDLSAELPLGVIEEEIDVTAYGKHEHIEIVKEEDLSSGEASYNVETNTVTATESEDFVKVLSEELPSGATFEAEEFQPFSSIAGEERSDKTGIDEERGQGIIDFDSTSSLESEVIGATTQQSEETEERDQEQEANEKKEEEVPERKPQSNDKLDGLPSEFESTTEDVLSDIPTSQICIDEDGMVMERDKKLIEENARLREMMEKLMEAGIEQLTVISNLTGRVRDLERKLSRKTKQRTRRYKRTPSSRPKKLFNVATKERAVEVAL